MCEELKACPFCGGEAEVYSHQNTGIYAGWLQHDVDHWIACLGEDCGAHQGMFGSEAEAITAWNTRHD